MISSEESDSLLDKAHALVDVVSSMDKQPVANHEASATRKSYQQAVEDIERREQMQMNMLANRMNRSSHLVDYLLTPEDLTKLHAGKFPPRDIRDRCNGTRPDYVAVVYPGTIAQRVVKIHETIPGSPMYGHINTADCKIIERGEVASYLGMDWDTYEKKLAANVAAVRDYDDVEETTTVDLNASFPDGVEKVEISPSIGCTTTKEEKMMATMDLMQEQIDANARIMECGVMVRKYYEERLVTPPAFLVEGYINDLTNNDPKIIEYFRDMGIKDEDDQGTTQEENLRKALNIPQWLHQESEAWKTFEEYVTFARILNSVFIEKNRLELEEKALERNRDVLTTYDELIVVARSRMQALYTDVTSKLQKDGHLEALKKTPFWKNTMGCEERDESEVGKDTHDRSHVSKLRVSQYLTTHPNSIAGTVLRKMHEVAVQHNRGDTPDEKRLELKLAYDKLESRLCAEEESNQEIIKDAQAKINLIKPDNTCLNKRIKAAVQRVHEAEVELSNQKKHYEEQLSKLEETHTAPKDTVSTLETLTRNLEAKRIALRQLRHKKDENDTTLQRCFAIQKRALGVTRNGQQYAVKKARIEKQKAIKEEAINAAKEELNAVVESTADMRALLDENAVANKVALIEGEKAINVAKEELNAVVKSTANMRALFGEFSAERNQMKATIIEEMKTKTTDAKKAIELLRKKLTTIISNNGHDEEYNLKLESCVQEMRKNMAKDDTDNINISIENANIDTKRLDHQLDMIINNNKYDEVRVLQAQEKTRDKTKYPGCPTINSKIEEYEKYVRCVCAPGHKMMRMKKVIGEMNEVRHRMETLRRLEEEDEPFNSKPTPKKRKLQEELQKDNREAIEKLLNQSPPVALLNDAQMVHVSCEQEDRIKEHDANVALFKDAISDAIRCAEDQKKIKHGIYTDALAIMNKITEKIAKPDTEYVLGLNNNQEKDVCKDIAEQYNLIIQAEIGGKEKLKLFANEASNWSYKDKKPTPRWKAFGEKSAMYRYHLANAEKDRAKKSFRHKFSNLYAKGYHEHSTLSDSVETLKAEAIKGFHDPDNRAPRKDKDCVLRTDEMKGRDTWTSKQNSDSWVNKCKLPSQVAHKNAVKERAHAKKAETSAVVQSVQDSDGMVQVQQLLNQIKELATAGSTRAQSYKTALTKAVFMHPGTAVYKSGDSDSLDFSLHGLHEENRNAFDDVKRLTLKWSSVPTYMRCGSMVDKKSWDQGEFDSFVQTDERGEYPAFDDETGEMLVYKRVPKWSTDAFPDVQKGASPEDTSIQRRPVVWMKWHGKMVPVRDDLRVCRQVSPDIYNFFCLHHTAVQARDALRTIFPRGDKGEMEYINELKLKDECLQSWSFEQMDTSNDDPVDGDYCAQLPEFRVAREMHFESQRLATRRLNVLRQKEIDTRHEIEAIQSEAQKRSRVSYVGGTLNNSVNFNNVSVELAPQDWGISEPRIANLEMCCMELKQNISRYEQELREIGTFRLPDPVEGIVEVEAPLVEGTAKCITSVPDGENSRITFTGLFDDLLDTPRKVHEACASVIRFLQQFYPWVLQEITPKCIEDLQRFHAWNHELKNHGCMCMLPEKEWRSRKVNSTARVLGLSPNGNPPWDDWLSGVRVVDWRTGLPGMTELEAYNLVPGSKQGPTENVQKALNEAAEACIELTEQTNRESTMTGGERKEVDKLFANTILSTEVMDYRDDSDSTRTLYASIEAELENKGQRTERNESKPVVLEMVWKERGTLTSWNGIIGKTQMDDDTAKRIGELCRRRNWTDKHKLSIAYINDDDSREPGKRWVLQKYLESDEGHQSEGRTVNPIFNWKPDIPFELVSASQRHDVSANIDALLGTLKSFANVHATRRALMAYDTGPIRSPFRKDGTIVRAVALPEL